MNCSHSPHDTQRTALGQICAVAILCFAVATGCNGGGDGHDHDHDHDHSPGGHSQDDGDHSHDHAMDDDAHGERHTLGEVQVSGLTATVYQFGAIEAGKEAHAEVEFSNGSTVTAVRLWYGDESGRGVMKAKADKLESGAYHAHIEVKEGVTGQLWVEVETASGREAVSVAPK